MVATDEPGLTFRLGEGVEGAEKRQPTPPAKTAPLADAAVRKILARLAPLKTEAGDQKEFAMRERSLPPPRTGTTIQASFPPRESPPAPDKTEAGPLDVLRHAPEGDVPIAPHVSLSFSQPMVAVTSLAELEKLPVPVQLTPQPPGRWRWVGTKTLLFEPRGDLDRLPMATAYTVTVPAGTRSATGGSLAREVSWKLATPPPTLKGFFPESGPVTREPLLFATFDQRIDAQAVLATVHVSAGGKDYALRLATADEIKADAIVSHLAADAAKDRSLVLRAQERLPVDADVSVAFGPGTPSAEGPLRTTQKVDKGFRTYGAMRITDQSCRKDDECAPASGLWVAFSNPIDAKRFAKEMVRVEPAIPGMKVVARGNDVSITGRLKGRTTYVATFSERIPDTFGQTHEKEEKVTFRIGSAPRTLFAMGGNFVVLDPNAGARFSVYSVNHTALRVKAFAEAPETWKDMQKFMREVWNREQFPPDPPGRRVIDETVAVKGEPDELTETSIDLSKALSGGSGSTVLVVEPTVRPKNRWEWEPIVVWIQVTPIGLDAVVDGEKLVGWATGLKDGKPLEGVDLTVVPTGVSARTDASGTARLPLGSPPGSMLVARWNGQIAFLPEATDYWGSSDSWSPSPGFDTYHWYVADDRQMYKPGEEVKLKGWIRKVGGGPTGDVVGWSGEAQKASYVLHDSQGNEVAKGEAAINKLGGFDVSLTLPKTMNLGYASLSFSAPGAGSTGHSIQVQEFRRPEFEVGARPSDGPYLVGASATVSVDAKYYAGGGLGNADTRWFVTAQPGHFTPPNRDDFIFGIEPSWLDSYLRRRDSGASRNESFAAHTDSGGKHVLRVDFLAVNPPRATNVVAQGTVMDVNRQAWSASANLLVHPASLYVGVKLDRPFVQHGEPLKLDAIVTDLDGKAVAGRKVQVHAVRLDWDWSEDGYNVKEVDPRDCELTSSDKAERCTIPTGEGGMYRVSATITDDQGRRNLTQVSVWVAGGKLPPERGVTVEPVRLLPDKKEYHGGETAEILVIPPWSPAEALLTLRRAGVLKTERFTITGASHTIKVPIEDGWTPNISVDVSLVGVAPRTNDSGEPDEKLGKRPAIAAGSVSLSIPPLSRKLALAVEPRDQKLEPGGETVVNLSLVDAKGEPVSGGEVAVVIVDEAVLSLTGYSLPDPVPTFYTYRAAGARDYHLRQSVLLARPEDLARPSTGALPGGGPRDGVRRGVMMKSMALGAPPPPPPAAPAPAQAKPEGESAREPAEQTIKVRSDFNALAVFAPSVTTDGKGHATVPVKLPDNLTRYRVMAIAVAGGRQFGAGESTITARLPLMVRPSPPRFLNFGDRFEMPVVLQNQTDNALDVDVAMRVANAELVGGAGQHVTVPANDRVELRFPAAANKAGTARFQFGAVASANGRWSDAAEVELPVWTPATSEAFATYGTIDSGAIAQPVKMPEGVFPQFGGLEISTSSTALQALTDAVMYLVRYPYECSEQMASRVIAIAALRDVLTAFKAEGLPPPDKMIESVQRDVEMLRRLQNSDGGWGFWKHGEESWPFLTAHVAHALARAKEKGFDVPKQMLDAAKPFLADIEHHIPSYYSKEARQALIGYALYVRNRMGDRDVAKAQKLAEEAGGVDKLPLEAVAWIYPVVSGPGGAEATVAAIRKLIGNRIEETAAAAHFTTSYSDGAYLLLASDRRLDALFLEGMILDQPKSDVIPKLVEGLLGHRSAGHWASTQEDGWVLLALDKYFNTYEKVTPDFIAKAWLGGQLAGDHPFRGRSAERFNIDIPMSWLAAKAQGTSDLIVAKEGAGRLYYRIGMSYAPTTLVMPPRDNGFTVQRDYEAVDDKADVQHAQDGTWHVKAGARVRVRLTLVAPARRYHVALVDPLPAGLEPMNPALATTGNIPKDPKDAGRGGWWWGPWYEHQNMRDERVEAFTRLLWEGVYTYTYVARATTPGNFVVPPTKAEEMYHPETFGRGAGDRLVVD
jgi:uncharacterized protein YfaS (alpha-2-macroglobulin family)